VPRLILTSRGPTARRSASARLYGVGVRQDRDRTPALLILQVGRRLTEVPPPGVAKAEELGRDAGKAAVSRVFDGSTAVRPGLRADLVLLDRDPVENIGATRDIHSSWIGGVRIDK
jgi:hypothetical protein